MTPSPPPAAIGDGPADEAGPVPDKAPVEALGLRRRAARGMLINAAFLGGLTSLGLIKGFVVAAFLSRSDYGVWGLLVVTLGTLSWLKQIGVSDRYVQQRDDDQELAFQRAFTLEILFSGAFLVLAAAVVGLTVVLYGRPELLAPGFALLLTIPAYILQSPLWVFYKRMEFLRQRRLEVLEPLVGFVVTVGLAIAGAGYWSLIVGMVAGAWAGALAILRASPYRLAFRYESGTVRQYVSFSWPLAVAGVGGIVVAQSSIIAGTAVLGLAGVGSITLASSIVLYTTQVDQIVSQTLYPAICAVADQPKLLFESFAKANRLGLMWGVPLGVAIALFTPDLVDFGLGARWRPALALIQIFGLIAAADQIGANWDDYYRARADTRPIAVVSIVTMFACVATAIPLLVVDGLTGFGIGMAFAAAVGIAGRIVYLVRLFPAFGVLRHSAQAILPTVPGAVIVLVLREFDGHRTPAVAIAEGAVYVLVTGAVTLWVERPLLREVKGYLRNP
ncbi:MAG TPA: oligosaccharide flippase family protein, partial [Solirubrobacteraceae bacterium]|nr:oligosaccharide flippase family protein [Solirubrobacteraceae bacterium]